MQPDQHQTQGPALAGPATTNNEDTIMPYVISSWAVVACLLLLGYLDQHEDKIMSLDQASGMASGAAMVAIALTAVFVVSTVVRGVRRWRS